jgi:peptide/nickel transport system ATP-binding protein
MPETQRPLLIARHITKSYLRGRWPSPKVRIVAIEDVNLTLMPRSTLALVGKSGSGKSTIAKCLARFEAPDSGQIRFQDRDILSVRGSELKQVRRNLQLVFQHSATAMNPLLTVGEIVAEPLRIRGLAKDECRERAMGLMEKLGIPEGWGNRLPLTFSGGQKQRLVLARALILEPRVLILDEALAGLDVPTQAQIASLLLKLQNDFSLSYVFISHDLQMAANFADSIAVMDRGRIVETGSAKELFSRRQCARTRELIESCPDLPKPSGTTDTL